MKRDPRLAELSRDHHHALVLARDALAKASSWTTEDGAALGLRFDDELEPHFQIEEELLLPALTRAAPTPGAGALAALVARTAGDHGFLREAMIAARRGDGQAAVAFSERLTEHVRFEERELFPACEAHLGASVLASVAQRSARTEPP